MYSGWTLCVHAESCWKAARVQAMWLIIDIAIDLPCQIRLGMGSGQKQCFKAWDNMEFDQLDTLPYSGNYLN